MLRAELKDISYNCRIKRYPDGSVSMLVADRDIFREPGWEAERSDADSTTPTRKAAEDKTASLARSKRRARSRIFDYAYANPELSIFATFTLDPARVDSRYDVVALTKRLGVWLDNRVRRAGLKYIVIPELHKDGAVHWHGLLNDVLPLVDSGTLKPATGGRPRKPRSGKERAALLAEGAAVIYNLPDWTFGFSSCMRLYGDRAAAVGYVCKYITKAPAKVGGRWYYSGGQLALPAVSLCYVDDIDNYEGAEFQISALNCRCWQVFYKNGGNFNEGL